MVFTTANDKLSIFGNTVDDIKDKFTNFTSAYEQHGLMGGNGALASLFGSKETIFTPELEEEFGRFQNLFNNSSKSAEVCAEELGITNSKIIDYAKTCKNGALSTTGFTDSLNAASLGARAGAVALKAFSVAGNMLVMWAATQLISSFVNFIDNLHTTLKEQQEITQGLQDELSGIQSEISDVNSKLESTSDRIDELNAKDALSFVEQEELDNLIAQNDELERKNKLLAEQEANKQQEVADSVKSEFDKEYGNQSYSRIIYEDMDAKRKRYEELYLNNGYNTDEEIAEMERLKQELADFDSKTTVSFEEHIQEVISEYETLNQKKRDGQTLTEQEEKKLVEYRKELVDTSISLDNYSEEYGIDDAVSQSWKNTSQTIYEALYPSELLTEKFNEVFNGLSVNVQSELKELAKNGSLSVDDLSDDIIEQFQQAGFSASEVIEQICSTFGEIEDLSLSDKSPISIADVFSLSDVQGNATALSELNDELSELQSAYNTCLAAKEEFDEQGYLSVDTLQKVLSLGDEYLQYLFDEEGNICLDTEAFQALTLARINDMEAQALSTLAENIKQITDEASATDYLAQKKNELATSYKDVAIAALAEMTALKGFNDSEAMQQAYDSYMSQYNQIDKLFANARAGVYETYSGKSKASGSSSKKAETDWKNMLESETSLLEKQLESALITFQEYVEKRREIIEKYYRDGKISAKDYYDALEKMYDYQKGIYDKVLSAVTKRFDREIDQIQDSIDAIEKQNEALEKQKDEYDTILSVVDSVYEKQIEHIQSQQDALQDTIDALQEENDKRKFALQLEQAKWELYQAQTQRTRKIFNGTEFVYDTDKDAIRDAQENLADLTLEQTVDGLEKEKDALDAVIEELEYYRSIWNEISGAREKSENEQLAIALWGESYESIILSNRLSDIESFKDNYLSTQQQINDNQTLIDSYNEKIEYYEALKESWNSITDAYETSMNEQLAAQVLGADWESQILSGRLETLQQFRDEYLAIQQAITDATFNAANASVENTGNTSNPSNSAGKGDGADGDSETPTISPNEWYDPVTKKSGIGNPPKIRRNIMMKYARGTDDAREGYHLIAETGTEIIRDNYGNAVIAKGKQLHHFDGGETVFSPSETRELLSGELMPLDPASADITPALKTQSDVLLEQWQKIVPDLSDLLLPARAALSTAHQFAETRSQAAPVVQNITLTLPNVTNNSGYERIKKELRQMQIDAYQNAHRRNP